MKIITIVMPRWALPALGALAALLLLGGCLEKRIVWSPDGSRAAVITKAGLYSSDGEGRLSSLLVPGVYAVAWMSDSQQMVVAQSRKVKDWATIERVLGPERAAVVTAEAESVWNRFQRGGVWSVLAMDLDGKKGLAKICLRDRHGAELRAKLDAGAWADLESKETEVHTLAVAHADGKMLAVGSLLYEGLGQVADIRVAAGDKAVAFTTEMKPDSDEFQLLVALCDGSTPFAVVARHVAACPDWTRDGRSVVYFESSDPGPAEDIIRLGALTQREVIDAAGKIKLEDKPHYLVGTLFDGFGRVRCLSDGRILFNAAEIDLPLAAEDYGEQREQLFALDPARQPTLVRLIPRKHESDLPQQLAYFEVSPDDRQVLFGSLKGEVCVVTLATGEVEVIQSARKDSPQGAPVWRKAGEFTYVKRSEPAKAGETALPGQIILRRGKEETVLSRSWPEEVVRHLIE